MANQDILAFQGAANTYNDIAQVQNQRLQMMAQEDARARQMQLQEEQAEQQKREQERLRYAEWEKQWILNSAQSRLKDLMKSEDTGVTDKQGNKLYREPSLQDMSIQQNRLASEEAKKRGRGDLATSFMAEAEKVSAMKAKMLQDEQKRKMDQQEKQLDIDKKTRELEAGRDGKAELSTIKDADKIFSDRTDVFKKQLNNVQSLLATAEKAALGSPQASAQLDTQLATLFDSGTLSKNDIERIKNAGSLVGRMENTISNVIQGTTSQSSLQDKAEFIRVMEKVLAENYNASVDGAVKTMGKTNIHPEILQDYAKRKYVIPGADEDKKGSGAGGSWDYNNQPAAYVETRTLPDGRKIGLKADGTKEIIK